MSSAGGISRFLSVVAIAGLTIGCGGGGKDHSASASTAAGVSSQQQTVVLHLPSARAEHTATLLASGEVLVVGGRDIAGDPVRSTVLVSSTAVRSGPDLTTARVGHSATLLSTGEVLIAGGQSDKAGATVLDTSEVFDPLTGTFAAGPKLAQKRSRHVAASFQTAQGEQVVFAGGQSGVTAQGAPVLLASAEVLNVATKTSAAITATLRAPQADARIARLDSGAFLIVGGQGATAAAGADVFDPASKTFTQANPVAARAGAAVVSKGREVLVAGGQSATGPEATTEVFDAQTRTFAQGVRLGQARRDAEVAIVNSELVVIGGRDAAGARGEVDRLAGAAIGQSTVKAGPTLQTARYEHTATAIAATKYAVIGGYDSKGAAIDTIEITDLSVVVSTAQSTSSTTTASGSLPLPLPGAGAGTATSPTTGTTTTTIPTSGTGSTSSGSTSSSGSSGLGGLLSGLLGGGSGSTGSGSTGSTILNAVLQSALQALTSTSGSGSGFSGFMSAFMQNLVANLLGGGSGGSSSGLSGILSGLLGGGSSASSGSGSSGSGLSGLLSGLLGSLSGGSSGGSSSSSSGLSGLLSSLLGGGSSGGSSSGSGLSGLLSGLLGGGSSGSTGGSSSSTAPSVSTITPGQGRVGDSVVISGANFSGQTSVLFNGIAAPITAASNTSITVIVPQGASTGAVTVSTAGTTVLAGTFTVL